MSKLAMRNALFYGMIFLLCFMGISIASSEKFTPVITVEVSPEGYARVVVNGETAVYFKTSNGTLSPTERARIVADRLFASVNKNVDVKTIVANLDGGRAKVVIGNSLLAIATRNEAAAQKTTPPLLALKWASNLRRLLTLPPLGVSPESLLVPLGETREAKVRCLLNAPVYVETSNPEIIAVHTQPGSPSLSINGLAIGNATITLRCGNYTACAVVRVRKYAAYPTMLPATGTVTGRSAPSSLVSKVAREAALRAVTLEPGATLGNLTVGEICTDLAPGQTVQTNVKLEALGDDYIPAKLSIPVRIQNTVLRREPTSAIMYSNSPEQVRKYQVLFTGQLVANGSPVRLLYHHQNVMGKRVGFIVELLNASASITDVHIVKGVALPNKDPLVAGYCAGLFFMENYRREIGYVTVLSPMTAQAIINQSLDHSYTASGVLELHQLSGNPILIRVIVKPEEQRLVENPEDVLVRLAESNSYATLLSDHIYPTPWKKIDVTHTIGRPWAFVRMGKEALKHSSQDKTLQGNYGVTYDIRARVENPQEIDCVAEVLFEASAGPVAGVFLVNGKMLDVKCLKPPDEVTLGRITVPAGKAKTFSIQTMPLAGSAYPATIIVRSNPVNHNLTTKR